MKGFQYAGISVGIKKNNVKDLGLIYSNFPATAAALFTKNAIKAAPVILGMEKIKSGKCQAVLVNSGNANCLTGRKGMKDAIFCARKVASTFQISEDLVQVMSTGVIGAPLPLDKFETGIPYLINHLNEENLADFAEAILTTDTRKKIVSFSGTVKNKPYSIAGIAKGSGMIRPDMATMLAFILTDVKISDKRLHHALILSNEKSFSRITIDGDTSTNDTLIALANETAGAEINDTDSMALFQNALDSVCFDLAKKLVKDGEGATKLVQIIVKGARTGKDAFKACDTIAHSNLVKTAIYGEDPNWGRIAAAAGRSGASVVPEKIDLWFNDLLLVKKGIWLGEGVEANVAKQLKKDEILITLDLNNGSFEDRFLFCDFSENYARINANYRT